MDPLRRLRAAPAPPRPPVGRVDGVRLALAGTDLLSLEYDPVLLLAHLDSVPLQCAANRPIAALRVGAVVAIPRDERRFARAGERGQGAVWGTPEDDGRGTGRIEVVREVV